jgi:hypothetical protein
MEDIYEDSNDAFNDIFGGAKYVNASRHNSDHAYNATAQALGYPQAVFNPKQGGYDGVDYSA